jgi:hypothetical protein
MNREPGEGLRAACVVWKAAFTRKDGRAEVLAKWLELEG